MTRYEFYNNLELFNKSKEITEQEEKNKVQTELNELKHYGTLGQKWGVRKWQNPDGTFNEAGKERYFGKSSKTNASEDKIGNKESSEQKIGSLNYTWDRMDNMYEYIDKYQNKDGSLTKKGQKLLDKGKNVESYINMDLYKKSKYTDEDWNNEIKKSEEHQKKLVDNAKAKVKTTKELSGDTINDQEFKDIVEELNNFHMRDFYKNHRKEYNDVADIGMDALNKSDEYGSESKIGDDSDREWFMWEDQTIGNPEIAYLYYKGYSKDYIKQYLNKPLTEELLKMQDEDPYAGGFFVRDEFHRGGDAYIDALFDKGEEEQKIGGLFSKDDTKKLAKEASKLEKELENAKYQDKQKIINDLINDDKYKDTIDEAIKPYVEKNKKNIDRVNEIFKDYEDDEINTLANAGIMNSLINKWGDKNNNETMKELAGYAWFYLNDDGNQGDNTAEYLYATIDKGVKAKELGNLWDNLRYSNEEKNENISSLKKDPFLANLSDDTLKEVITNKFENKFNKGSYWNLYNASDTAYDPDDTVKKAYSEAKNISKKLEKSCGNTNGWDYFWKAVDNLNMGDMNYKDLSQADWDKINAEINRLK